MSLFRAPREPDLHPDVLADLERCGRRVAAEIVRGLPDRGRGSAAPDDTGVYSVRAGSDGSTSVRVTKADIETWLAWQSARRSWRRRVAIALTSSGALLGALSLLGCVT